MIDRLAITGHWGIEQLRHFGKWHNIMLRLFYPPHFRKGFPLVIQQVYSEGVLSLLSFPVFYRLVLALQGYHTLENLVHHKN